MVTLFNFIDFQTLSTKISKRTLDGAKVTLEQIEQADSVLVENLRPGTTPDLLTLYFESRGGGGQTVKDAMMLSEGTAKVSFVNPDCKFYITVLQFHFKCFVKILDFIEAFCCTLGLCLGILFQFQLLFSIFL